MTVPEQKETGTDYSQHPSVKGVFERESLDPIAALADRLEGFVRLLRAGWHLDYAADSIGDVAAALRQHAERGGDRLQTYLGNQAVARERGDIQGVQYWQGRIDELNRITPPTE